MPSGLPPANYPVPSTFTRADGGDSREGIKTPVGVVLVTEDGQMSDLNDDPSIKLREMAESPEVERAEQGTIVKTFVCDYAEAETRISILGRGTLLVSEDGDVSRVLSSSLKRQNPGYALLTVVAESISFDSPPDEFECTPVELGINIIKYPRYFPFLDPSPDDATKRVTVGNVSVNISSIKQSIIRSIQTYQDAPLFPSADNINGMIQDLVMGQLQSGNIDVPYCIYSVPFDPLKPTINGTKWDGVGAHLPGGNYNRLLLQVPTSAPEIAMAAAAGREIISKLWRQEDTPYLIGYEVKWHSYWFRPPLMHPGGVIDDPIFGSRDEIPDYFISTEYPPDRHLTVFDWLPVDNPQCYSVAGYSPGGRGVYGSDYQISWLRKADEIRYERTWFKLTRTWLGAPIGYVDQQFYTAGPRPTLPTDFVTTFDSLIPTP